MGIYRVGRMEAGMARMLGKARSDHDLMWCCPGHDPGLRLGARHGRRLVLGRRGQRAREKARWQRLWRRNGE